MEAESSWNAIVLSGGGTRSIAQIGALQYVHETSIGGLVKVKEYAGTSAGSVICFLLAVGYSPQEIFSKACSTDFESLLLFGGMIDPDPPDGFRWKMGIDRIHAILSQYGMLSLDPLVILLDGMAKDRLGETPTFSSLLKLTGKRLVVTAVNLTTNEVEYFCPENTPGILCTTAIRLSCTIPLVFRKAMHNGCCYVDGGLADNFPVSQISLSRGRILGVIVDPSGATSQFPVDTFMGYIMRSIMFPIRMGTTLRCENKKTGTILKVIKVNVDSSSISFAMDETVKAAMFLEGYKAAREVEEEEESIC